MKRITLLWLVIICSISGCGVTTSEVVPAGKDTFYISGHGYAKKAPEAMTELYREANRHCIALEKYFMPVSSGSEPFDQMSSSVQMHFRCLTKADYELAERPVMRSEPITKIEVNHK